MDWLDAENFRNARYQKIQVHNLDLLERICDCLSGSSVVIEIVTERYRLRAPMHVRHSTVQLPLM